MGSNSILGLTPEFFNLKMLLQPLEEKLNLPSVMLQFRDHHRAYIQSFVPIKSVCEEDKSFLVHVVPLNDPSDFIRVFSHGKLPVHMADGIG